MSEKASPDQIRLRMCYLGAVRLLADTFPRETDPERRDLIEQALDDMTELTGVTWTEDPIGHIIIGE